MSCKIIPVPISFRQKLHLFLSFPLVVFSMLRPPFPCTSQFPFAGPLLFSCFLKRFSCTWSSVWGFQNFGVFIALALSLSLSCSALTTLPSYYWLPCVRSCVNTSLCLLFTLPFIAPLWSSSPNPYQLRYIPIPTSKTWPFITTRVPPLSAVWANLVLLHFGQRICLGNFVNHFTKSSFYCYFFFLSRYRRSRCFNYAIRVQPSLMVPSAAALPHIRLSRQVRAPKARIAPLTCPPISQLTHFA